MPLLAIDGKVIEAALIHRHAPDPVHYKSIDVSQLTS
jgi:hypothetical protein